MMKYNLLFEHAKNKKQRSALLLHRLISVFVFHCLDSIMSLVSKTQNLKPLKLAALAVQAGLCLTWLETPKTVFSLCEQH